MRRLRRPAFVPVSIIALAAFLTGAQSGEEIQISCLEGPVGYAQDADGVPQLTATNDLDLACAEGYVHARDRLFQMDLTRREVSGDLAEVLGAGVLGSDVQNRTIGLRRAAERSLTVLTARELAVLQAYADGVNAYLANNPLPPEYALLELTQVRPWQPVDSLVIGKAISASLSLDIDVGPTLQLQQFVAAGIDGGFDGQSLLFNDVRRSAPMDPASTVPDATNGTPFAAKGLPKADPILLARAAEGARRLKQKFEGIPFFERAMAPRETFVGSNEWGVTAAASATGRPIIANDPHLSLDAPSTFYEWHLIVNGDPVDGDMNVSGVGFAGTPGVILGQNERITWGATTNPMDVSDIFQDQLEVLTSNCFLLGKLACILSEGVFHPVEIEFTTYFFNVIGDTIPDNLQDAGLPLEQTVIATVPFRSFGPVLDIEDPGVLVGGGVTTALVLQYTGFHATRELSAFSKWNRAGDLDEFLEGLADFDVGSQNWAYADSDGNLAYFASAENPLRKDLEDGAVAGLPPFLIRDGSGPNNWVPDPGQTQGQSIPFAVLPADEMPQTVNPSNGFFVNANNDPAGTTLDNDPLNQFRPSKPTAIYYLSPGYAIGLRAGRITRLVQGQVEAGELVTVNNMKRFQANTQQLDAELMTPFLLGAFDSALAPGAPPELAALGADPEIAEAVGRLGDWDFSAPTGIPEGYDAHDAMGNRSDGVPTPEANTSVAATIYNVWRAKAIKSIVDATLNGLGSLGVGSGDALKALYHLLSAEPFTGLSTAGDVDFFPQPAGLSAEERRDVTLLAALRTALDALASNDFAAAFGNSTNQDDYRWGRLHRITFDHPINPAWSIPPEAGFDDLAPDLPGLSRDGGYNVVNASGFSARADGSNEFRFGGGPVRRYVGEAARGSINQPTVVGFNVVPGGPSGVPGDPDYATQLGVWLTADYHRVNMGPKVPMAGSTRETFVPSP
jgi:penicillin amidase